MWEKGLHKICGTAVIIKEMRGRITAGCSLNVQFISYRPEPFYISNDVSS